MDRNQSGTEKVILAFESGFTFVTNRHGPMMSSDMEFMASDSDSDGGQWRTELVYLRPGTGAWTKRLGMSTILTLVSMTFGPSRPAPHRAILRLELSGTETVLCSLFDHRPSQAMRLIWAGDQCPSLTNTGNSPLSLSLLIKDSAV
jgi:hypothetical protein